MILTFVKARAKIALIELNIYGCPIHSDQDRVRITFELLQLTNLLPLYIFDAIWHFLTNFYAHVHASLARIDV